ncbi:MAG: cysteine synthase CysM [Crocinitomicaceae bacterium]|nr:cysteine synthase CysM [Crocinitomicaceae bacterium]
MKKILDTIGNTPLIELSTLASNPNVRIYAKLEGNNPGGSVKDRAALNMIQTAMENGEIQPGDTLIEATSGNTGIALAMVARLVGVNMILVMPDSATEERKKTMRAYGAKLILTPAEKTIEYARIYTVELVEKKGYKTLNQFENPENWKAHYKSTGPEIWEATEGQITHFVSAMGTTGTIMGVSRYLKEQEPSIEIIGAQPADGAKISGIRRWSKEFRPKIYEEKRVDRLVNVSEEEAIQGARSLAQEEGVLAGMSSGGAYDVAKKMAAELAHGVIVFIVCDRGDRYMSTDLFGRI